MASGPSGPDDSKRARRRRPANGNSADPNQFYILATSPTADERPRVLMHGNTFGVFDHYGDIKQLGLREEGIFHEGTRYLSRLLLGLGRFQPLFLSSTVQHDNDLLAVDLTNPDIFEGKNLVIPRGTLHLFRTKLIWQDGCYECVRVKNYGLKPVTTELGFHFEADFADVFEVRGLKRKQRGRLLEPEFDGNRATLAYEGLDRVRRQTHLEFNPEPTSLDGDEASFEIVLEPQHETAIYVSARCERDGASPPVLSYDRAAAAVTGAWDNARDGCCSIRTSNAEFNDLLSRTAADLHMMTVETPSGPYPYAGVPWFSTPFGRDGIITALQCLWLSPELARGVLTFLAETQATETNPEQDAEPGKILHEMRYGEMAALHEIPFGRYYGSVDATPLFLVLAGAYWQRSGDRQFIESIWPNLERALAWMDKYGDADGDGFIEYQRRSESGLTQQGWKDSGDSIFHADGALAEGPIALCEVQGYAFAARLAMAELAEARRQTKLADNLLAQARSLQEKFEQSFWCEQLSTYALALDGKKRQCRVRASNAGQCLFTGIAGPEHATRVAHLMLAPESFSGWGIRTLATSEIRYNPMSYHNGSVWPHDNALIAAGLARSGHTDLAMEVLSRLFDASMYMDLHRLPELFCGFPRRPGEGPTLYPVACSPQAWSSAAVYLLLQSCLGLHVDALHGQISFSQPALPEFLSEVHIHNLRIGQATADLLLRRVGRDVGINVLRREGQIEVMSMK
jgi:glycogen debranching enzyme